MSGQDDRGGAGQSQMMHSDGIDGVDPVASPIEGASATTPLS